MSPVPLQHLTHDLPTAAGFLEDLQSRYEADPRAVGEGWRAFFGDLKTRGVDDVAATGPSWARGDWPVPANGEMVSALDSDWTALESDLNNKIGARAQTVGIGLSSEEMRSS